MTNNTTPRYATRREQRQFIAMFLVGGTLLAIGIAEAIVGVLILASPVW